MAYDRNFAGCLTILGALRERNRSLTVAAQLGLRRGLMEPSVVNRAESTRLLPSRDRQGAVSPKRLSTQFCGSPRRAHNRTVMLVHLGITMSDARTVTLLL